MTLQAPCLSPTARALLLARRSRPARLARAPQLKIATVFGAFLDPVADKIMVSTSLILLTTSPPAHVTARAMVLPVALMICREITMSALREWAAASGGAAHKVGARCRSSCRKTIDARRAWAQGGQRTLNSQAIVYL